MSGMAKQDPAFAKRRRFWVFGGRHAVFLLEQPRQVVGTDRDMLQLRREFFAVRIIQVVDHLDLLEQFPRRGVIQQIGAAAFAGRIPNVNASATSSKKATFSRKRSFGFAGRPAEDTGRFHAIIELAVIGWIALNDGIPFLVVC